MPARVFEGNLDASDLRFGIVAARFNSVVCDRLQDAAVETLLKYGAAQESISIVRVPGAFEVPQAARVLGDSKTCDMDGQKLSFRVEDGEFVDDQTGSVWNILGEAVAGEMKGKSLSPIIHGNHFWFAWGAFNPDTLIYKGQG